jgi:hypothetical protein
LTPVGRSVLARNDGPAALLINFNHTTLRAGLKKLLHPDLYQPRRSEERDDGEAKQ